MRGLDYCGAAMTSEISSAKQSLLPLPSPMAFALTEGQVQVEGIVGSLVFVSPDADFAVIRLDVPGQIRPVVTIGALAGLRVGETVKIIGRYEQHERYGQRLRAEQALPQLPESRLGIERYMATLAGIGPELARRIVQELGTKALTALEEETFRVAQVKGVGKKRAQRALADARARHEERAVMVFLQGLGISAAYASRIRKQWGQAAITKVRENPYALARDVAGIGFQIADRIAKAMGVEPLSPLRLLAGVRHALATGCESGHCYLPERELVARSVLLLQPPLPDDAPPNSPPPPVDDKLTGGIVDAIASLQSHGETIHEGDAIYLTSLHQQEVELTRQAARLTQAIRTRIPTISEHDIAITLAEGQRAALHRVESSPLSIITGGPGTGKTTIISALVRAYLRAGLRVCLVAPTGRAAKRLSDATEHPARTIHRQLNLIPGERVKTAKDLMREPVFVPESCQSVDLFVRLERTRQALAIVVDEYGGAVGIVTVEDLLEEVVGEINDEYDEAPPAISRQKDGSYRVQARTSVDQLNRELKLDLPESDEYESLAGLLLERLKHIPRPGEQLRIGSVTIEVLVANERRIEEVVLRPGKKKGA